MNVSAIGNFYLEIPTLYSSTVLDSTISILAKSILEKFILLFVKATQTGAQSPTSEISLIHPKIQTEKYIWPKETVCEGDHLNGVISEKGKFTQPDGSIYEGDFLNNQMTGKGKRTWPNGVIYEGDFLNNQMTGKGKRTWPNGDIYEGDFLNNQMTGKGKFTRPNGEIDEGDFLNGVISEKGKRTWPNGGIYEGDFLNNQMTGIGKYRWPDGGIYEGDFLNNQMTGKGTHIYADGRTFEGTFLNALQITNCSNLTDLNFLELLCGTSDHGTKSEYAMGIMADFLMKSGHDMEGKLLANSLEVLQLQRDWEDGQIAHFLKQQGEPTLLYAGSENHAVSLLLQPREEKLICEIYNSGKGLEKYHKYDRKTNKFQTMLRVQIPSDAMTVETLQQILTRKLSIYEIILKIPGASILKPTSQGAVWQSPQKASNCSLEWIFAYLKNKMPPYTYNEMRLNLFQRCLCEIQKIAYPQNSLQKVGQLIQILEKKIAKRLERKHALVIWDKSFRRRIWDKSFRYRQNFFENRVL